MFTSVQIHVQEGSDSSHSSITQAENEPLSTFMVRIQGTIEIHQGAMRDIRGKKFKE